MICHEKEIRNSETTKKEYQMMMVIVVELVQLSGQKIMLQRKRIKILMVSKQHGNGDEVEAEKVKVKVWNGLFDGSAL